MAAGAPAGIRLPLVVGSAGSTGALAAGHITRFAGIDFPHYIVTGPDGALWFVNMQDDSIGRITTTGQARTFSAPQMSIPATITVGPDGALWFTSLFARLTPSGRFTYFTVPNKDEAWDITNGPGGLWFSDIQGEAGGGGAIGLITAR